MRTLSLLRTLRRGSSTASGTCRSKFSPNARRSARAATSRSRSRASAGSRVRSSRSRSFSRDTPRLIHHIPFERQCASMTTYTLSQAEAIACLDQPLQIIACAGSGKTQVISQRIAAILAQPGVKPRNVIAFTFTDKAAAELKERVLSIVQRELGPVPGLAEMYIGTMHAYCLDLLQRLVPDKVKFSVLTALTAQ